MVFVLGMSHQQQKVASPAVTMAPCGCEAEVGLNMASAAGTALPEVPRICPRLHPTACTPSDVKDDSQSDVTEVTSARCCNVKLRDVNDYLVCLLCRGYFVDATSVAECLHTFCRSCILLYLENEHVCPTCSVPLNLNHSKPQLCLKPDKTLQDIVYKLVPGLFHNEMRRRLYFYTEYPEMDIHLHPEFRGISVDRMVYSPADLISVSLQYYDGQAGIDPTKLLTHFSRNASFFKPVSDGSLSVKKRRCFECPAALRVAHIKKLITSKYNLKSSRHAVEVFYKRAEYEILPNEYSLMDIAYIYTWKRNIPMLLYYKIMNTLPCELEQSAIVDTSCRLIENTICPSSSDLSNVKDALSDRNYNFDDVDVKNNFSSDAPLMAVVPQPSLILPTNPSEQKPITTANSRNGSEKCDDLGEMHLRFGTIEDKIGHGMLGDLMTENSSLLINSETAQKLDATVKLEDFGMSETFDDSTKFEKNFVANGEFDETAKLDINFGVTKKLERISNSSQNAVSSERFSIVNAASFLQGSPISTRVSESSSQNVEINSREIRPLRLICPKPTTQITLNSGNIIAVSPIKPFVSTKVKATTLFLPSFQKIPGIINPPINEKKTPSRRVRKKKCESQTTLPKLEEDTFENESTKVVSNTANSLLNCGGWVRSVEKEKVVYSSLSNSGGSLTVTDSVKKNVDVPKVISSTSLKSGKSLTVNDSVKKNVDVPKSFTSYLSLGPSIIDSSIPHYGSPTDRSQDQIDQKSILSPSPSFACSSVSAAWQDYNSKNLNLTDKIKKEDIEVEIIGEVITQNKSKASNRALENLHLSNANILSIKEESDNNVANLENVENPTKNEKGRVFIETNCETAQSTTHLKCQAIPDEILSTKDVVSLSSTNKEHSATENNSRYSPTYDAISTKKFGEILHCALTGKSNSYYREYPSKCKTSPKLSSETLKMSPSKKPIISEVRGSNSKDSFTTEVPAKKNRYNNTDNSLRKTAPKKCSSAKTNKARSDKNIFPSNVPIIVSVLPGSFDRFVNCKKRSTKLSANTSKRLNSAKPMPTSGTISGDTANLNVPVSVNTAAPTNFCVNNARNYEKSKMPSPVNVSGNYERTKLPSSASNFKNSTANLPAHDAASGISIPRSSVSNNNNSNISVTIDGTTPKSPACDNAQLLVSVNNAGSHQTSKMLVSINNFASKLPTCDDASEISTSDSRVSNNNSGNYSKSKEPVSVNTLASKSPSGISISQSVFGNNSNDSGNCNVSVDQAGNHLESRIPLPLNISGVSERCNFRTSASNCKSPTIENASGMSVISTSSISGRNSENSTPSKSNVSINCTQSKMDAPASASGPYATSKLLHSANNLINSAAYQLPTNTATADFPTSVNTSESSWTRKSPTSISTSRNSAISTSPKCAKDSKNSVTFKLPASLKNFGANATFQTHKSANVDVTKISPASKSPMYVRTSQNSAIFKLPVSSKSAKTPIPFKFGTNSRNPISVANIVPNVCITLNNTKDYAKKIRFSDRNIICDLGMLNEPSNKRFKKYKYDAKPLPNLKNIQSPSTSVSSTSNICHNMKNVLQSNTKNQPPETDSEEMNKNLSSKTAAKLVPNNLSLYTENSLKRLKIPPLIDINVFKSSKSPIGKSFIPTDVQSNPQQGNLAMASADNSSMTTENEISLSSIKYPSRNELSPKLSISPNAIIRGKTNPNNLQSPNSHFWKSPNGNISPNSVANRNNESRQKKQSPNANDSASGMLVQNLINNKAQVFQNEKRLPNSRTSSSPKRVSHYDVPLSENQFTRVSVPPYEMALLSPTSGILSHINSTSDNKSPTPSSKVDSSSPSEKLNEFFRQQMPSYSKSDSDTSKQSSADGTSASPTCSSNGILRNAVEKGILPCHPLLYQKSTS